MTEKKKVLKNENHLEKSLLPFILTHLNRSIKMWVYPV